jgi:hypothetical protein
VTRLRASIVQLSKFHHYSGVTALPQRGIFEVGLIRATYHTTHRKVNGQFAQKLDLKAQRESRGIAMLFLQPRCQIGVGDQRHAPAASPPGKGHGTHSTESWAGLDRCVKSRTNQDSILYERQSVRPYSCLFYNKPQLK